MVSAQIAFCILVLFVSGLFVQSFQRLINRPLGFSSDRVLIMESAAAKQQPPEVWTQVADRLREKPGVQAVSIASWPLLSGNRWSGTIVVPGKPVDVIAPYILAVSPGFFQTMQIQQIDGRDFRLGDVPPRLTPQGEAASGVGIVNEAFARRYFAGQNPLGKLVKIRQSKNASALMEIVGYVRDAAYYNLREPIRPTMYLPMTPRGSGAFLVRTAGDPLSVLPSLRQSLTQARSDFRVRSSTTQKDYIVMHTIRERLLATLSLFFALLALALSAVGLYGVLNYTVTRQRREIGIRMALGAPTAHVLTRITQSVVAMVAIGSAAGIAGGLFTARFLEALLFEIKATDLSVTIAPVALLLTAAFFAALPPVVRAVRIDPAETLRTE
jgi:predicted permease